MSTTIDVNVEAAFLKIKRENPEGFRVIANLLDKCAVKPDGAKRFRRIVGYVSSPACASDLDGLNADINRLLSE